MATCEKEENREAAHRRPSTPPSHTTEPCPLAEEEEHEEIDQTWIRIRVVLYDPLADAGLYDEWAAGIDVPAEIAASGVRCGVKMTKQNGESEESVEQEITVPESGDDPSLILDVDDLVDGSEVEVELPQLSTTGSGAAYVSIHTEDGAVTVDDGEDAEEPHPRNACRCRAGASCTLRIWLRPKTIVLHWSVGRRHARPTSKAGRNYHFRVEEEDDAVNLRFGASADDPRFWRHNLRIDGVPSVPGVDDVAIEVNRNLGGTRGRYWRSDGSVLAAGYAGHAGGFNTGSVGFSACGMSGSTEALIDDTHAITDAQIDRLVTEVANLCRAWRLAPEDAHQLCTHFEVNRLHRNKTPPGKWDITWLPEEHQDSYSDAHAQRLCTREPADPPAANQPFRYRRYTDVELDGTFARPPAAGATSVMTDRVSAYLRELIAAEV